MGILLLPQCTYIQCSKSQYVVAHEILVDERFTTYNHPISSIWPHRARQKAEHYRSGLSQFYQLRNSCKMPNSTQFLRATAGTAIARLSHRNSVRLSVRLSVTPVDQAKTVQARIIKSSPSADPKTLLVSGSVTLFQKFHRGHPNRGP